MKFAIITTDFLSIHQNLYQYLLSSVKSSGVKKTNKGRRPSQEKKYPISSIKFQVPPSTPPQPVVVSSPTAGSPTVFKVGKHMF